MPFARSPGFFGHVPVDEAVRHLRRRGSLERPADVLDDPEVAVRIVLYAFVAAAAESAGDVDHLGRIVRRRRVGGRVRVLGREQQSLGERIPGHAVDRRDRGAARILRGEHRHPMGCIGVEVDPRDVAGRSTLVTLEEVVLPVVVAQVASLQATVEHEIDVLVRLGLVGLRVPGCGRGDHDRLPVRVQRVVVVAVVRHRCGRVLGLRRALGDRDLGQAGREHRGRQVPLRPRVRRDIGEVGRRRRGHRHGDAEDDRQRRCGCDQLGLARERHVPP